MDPATFIAALEAINYLEIFGLLLKWGIPLLITLIMKDVLVSIAKYIAIRSDKYIAIGKWVTYKGFTGKIVKLGPFSVVIENEKKDGYKISVKDFNDLIHHPIKHDPTKENCE